MPGLSAIELPTMHRVHQQFEEPRVVDISAAIRRELDRPEIASQLQPGRRAALAVGSRGIANLVLIVRTLADELIRRGLKVFIIPAMGSHGGGTAEGQKKVLEHLGVSEDSIGVPIRSRMDVVEVGQVAADHILKTPVLIAAGHPAPTIPVYMDAGAHREANLVIPVVRIKPHTGFKGPVESGICKMLTIGLGKHIGCTRLHRQGYAAFDWLIPAGARVVLETGKIGFSLAVVENAREETAHLEAVPASTTLMREPQLLQLAKTLLPRLLLPRVDVLVIEQIGKDLSGMGLDSNVTGRGPDGPLPGFDGPAIRRIVVLGLSAATHGNAQGLGLADFTTDEVLTKMDRAVTWTNSLASGSLAAGKIPIAMASADDAIRAAIACVPGVPPEDVTVVRIRSTLHLARIAVSANLLDTVRKISACQVEGIWDGNWSE